MHYMPRRGGGRGLRTIGSKIIRSKSNSITFYRSLEMRNQVQTQKEWSQATSIQQNSMHYMPRGEGGGVGDQQAPKLFAPNPILSRSIGPLGCVIK